MNKGMDLEKFERYVEAANRGVPAMMTIHEVMDLTGISHDCLAHWRCKGIGPRWIKFGRAVRYPVKDFIEYIHNGEQKPPTEFPSVW